MKHSVLIAIGLVSVGCSKKPDEAPKPTPAVSEPQGSGSVPTTPTTPTTPTSPPGEPGTIACSDVLTAADVKATCSVDVTLATPPDQLDNIGPDSTCSRRFSDGAGGSMTIMLSRMRDSMRAPDPAWTNVQTLAGIGDAARTYESVNRGGDPQLNLQLRKGGIDAYVFTWKLGGGDAPCKTKLATLAPMIVGRLP